MSEDSLLTIIMPCYNGSLTISRALDSIAFQKTRYKFSVLVIDDGSTDNSADIVRKYMKKYEFIKLIENEQNLGNAKTFHKGLSLTKTKYFAVLDVDDYYTRMDKIERQLSFLEGDVNEVYVAVTHGYIIDLGDGNVVPISYPRVDEFNYVDFLTQNSGYYHTSTYVYRNIFNGNPPWFFTEQRFRGDTVRTASILMYSNKKIKVLRYFGSAYSWSGNGIWSSLDQKKQLERQINIWKGLEHLSKTDFEVAAYRKLTTQCEEKYKVAETTKREYEAISLSEAIDSLNKLAGRYAFSQREFVFNGLYMSDMLNTCADSLRSVYFHNFNFVRRELDSKAIAIVVCTLNPEGGGIFREITEICEMLKDYNISIISTEEPSSKGDVKSIFKKYANVKLFLCKDKQDKLLWLSRTYYSISPFRAYYYDSHKDFYPYVNMDDRCENVCLFSYDHGFVTGLTSQYFKHIIAKRPIDYKLLRGLLGEKVLYIPAWNDASKVKHQYFPFNHHNNIVTACGAARFYKLDSGGAISYAEMIAELLNRTGGKHIHFGPIPDDKLAEIYEKMEKKGVSKSSFVYLGWVENPPEVLIENDVDLFIEPFPIVSFKISMDMMMRGIPIISFDGYTRMSKMDFTYEGSLKWRTVDDFYTTICSLSRDSLLFHSKKSSEYFYTHHDREVVREFFIGLRSFETIPNINCTDNVINYAEDFSRLFDTKLITKHNEIVRSISCYHDPRLNSTLFGKLAIILMRINGAIINKGIVQSDVQSKDIMGLLDHNTKYCDKKAYKLCCKSNQYPLAQAWLGRLYARGKGVDVNVNKAIEWYNLSITSGGAPNWAYVELAELLIKKGDSRNKKRAFDVCVMSVEKGNRVAYGMLGRMYRDGVGTSKNSNDAMLWLKKAFDSGINWAGIEYADIAIKSGIADNVNSAIDVYKKTSEINVSAIRRLIKVYRDGNYVPRDLNEAFHWLDVAKEKNAEWFEDEYLKTLICSHDE